ncbi:MAG: phosphoribosylglycinamide formyltransferase [Clostridia bacterium]|jgi:phosphoribosylglycinamide formyltransferase-1|nr:phosphoribosylglycinamide formyltransferase [Clostridia bacterium]
MNKIKIAVLCSGGGTNFQAILNAQEAGLIAHGEVGLLVSDSQTAYALERARRNGVKTAVADKKIFTDRKAREQEIMRLLAEYGAQLVVLAGFMTVLSGEFVKAYENAIINVHPALIPSFCGEGMYGLHVHEAVLARGVKVTGATVHYVNEVCDGGPIIAQKAVEVREGDTPELLQKRVMREAEWVILPEAVETVCKKLSEESNE